ncbi:hypothetical protein LFL96_14140 [Paraburkholderia sp. D15]|uniref:hypothetical protein n=1 Tax=Paraburkholderia sp. D15 TaxID=2880218 RepID=UPI00247947B7|nr:hypothetical protein [Paraburkholderia sp. D15]WGS48906.1 hypothetical protein LFL96_14140 [Paraburkholderia sp. D15]WKF56792.1 hypothetical protein HUO10_001260 [Paraburkholderia busanensis]
MSRSAALSGRHTSAVPATAITSGSDAALDRQYRPAIAPVQHARIPASRTGISSI